MKFYCIRDCYSGQIEARSIINLRLGYNAVGIAVKGNGTREQLGWIRWNLFPCFSLALFCHTGQMAQWNIIRLKIGKVFQFGWVTKGDAVKGGWHTWGPWFRLLKFK